VGKFAAYIKRPKTKSVSASGRLRPLTSDQELCPWTPLGASLPYPRYGASRLYLCGLQLSGFGTADSHLSK